MSSRALGGVNVLPLRAIRSCASGVALTGPYLISPFKLRASPRRRRLVGSGSRPPIVPNFRCRAPRDVMERLRMEFLSKVCGAYGLLEACANAMSQLLLWRAYLWQYVAIERMARDRGVVVFALPCALGTLAM